MQQRKNEEIFLNSNELESIYKIAKHTSPEKFEKILSEGIDLGIEKFNRRKETFKLLYKAAKTGNYKEFIELYESNRHVVNINKLYTKKQHGQLSFLSVLIKNDLLDTNHPSTIERVKLAQYLLDHGAKIDNYNEESCPCEMYYSSLSFFGKGQSFGKNIFPILKKYCDELQNQSTEICKIT